MFDTENIIPKHIELLDGQIDIILKALELYAFNLHNTWGIEVDTNLNELRNALLFHTYESLIAQKNGNYRMKYNVLKECKLISNRKRKNIYFKTKKFIIKK